MRIVTEKRLREFMRQYPDAYGPLLSWVSIMRRGRWENIDQLKRTFPTADGVAVKSRRTVTVFNVRGNKYRLITAIHCNKQRVYVMRFLTHAEYDKDKWKDQL